MADADTTVVPLAGKPLTDPPDAALDPAVPAPAATTIDWKDSAPLLLMVLVTTGFFGLVLLMVFHQIPPENVNVVNVVLGSIGTAWVSAMSYFFGSTAASKSK